MRSRSLLVPCLALVMTTGCYSSWSTHPKSSQPSTEEAAKNEREVTGRIVSYTTAPRGEMDGFVLDTGNRVHFPITAGSALLPLVQKGDVVTVRGTVTTRPEGKVIEASSITNEDKNERIDVASISSPSAPERATARQTEGVPPPGKTRSTTTLTGAELTAKEGRVKGYTTAPDGNMDGVLLDNGVRVHFPPAAGEALLPLVQEGKAIRVVGWEVTGPEGTMLEATKISGAQGGPTVDIAEVAAPPEPKVTPGAVAPPGAKPLGVKRQPLTHEAQQHQEQHRKQEQKRSKLQPRR
jgi:hypothetical protein